uniref:Proteolipid protein 2b n=1 Tax=Xiphophorus couchianus TaxID=32473 RepID=A0A3B5M4F2_9TELE
KKSTRVTDQIINHLIFKNYIIRQTKNIYLIILICYASSRNGGYTAAAVCEMCFAIVFFCVFMMDLDKQFTAISWVWSDLIRAFTGTLVYLITSLVCVISGAGDGALIAGGVTYNLLLF